MESYGVIEFTTYLIGVVAVILLPGPNSMYCLYVASSRGVIEGYKTVSAIIIADVILMLAATLGAATLLQTSAVLFSVFKGLGGLYLLYLGYNLLTGAYRNLQAKNNQNANIETSETDLNNAEVDSISKKKDEDKSAENVFLKAFILGLSNPKAIVFFLSFFLQFVDPTYDKPMLSFAILGAALLTISFLYLSLLIFTGTRLVNFFSRRKYLVFFSNAGVGILFIGFAVSLWMAKI